MWPNISLCRWGAAPEVGDSCLESLAQLAVKLTFTPGLLTWKGLFCFFLPFIFISICKFGVVHTDPEGGTSYTNVETGKTGWKLASGQELLKSKLFWTSDFPILGPWAFFWWRGECCLCLRSPRRVMDVTFTWHSWDLDRLSARVCFSLEI